MNAGGGTGRALDGGQVAASIGGGVVLPASPLPLTEQQLEFRRVFCEEYARRDNGCRGAGATAVRAAIERVGGSEKAHARPGEVARRLLRQGPVRDRIAQLRGAPLPAPPRPAVRAKHTAIPAACTASCLPPDTAARLAATAFDPAMPTGVARAAITALQAGIDARRTALIRSE